MTTQIGQLEAGDEFEVVCIDDHSSEYYLNLNNGICDLANYIRLEENAGRAQIRNMFLKYTKGEWLLFLDNDSEVPDHFLETYRNNVDEKFDVIVGGRVYDKRGDDRQHRLRYLYGTRIESRSAEEREKNPYRSFMTNNFMVRRSILGKIKFDPRISQYGHEDTLFGYRLAEEQVPILHVDNAVVNGYVETNAEFLQKTEEGIESLAKIYGFMREDRRFCDSVKLIRVYAKVRQLGLTGIVHRLFKMTKRRMEARFARGTAISLTLFSFYKLGLFIDKIHYGM